MKKFTTLLLIGAMTFVPIHQTRAQAVPLFCIAIGAILVGGAVVVYVHSCGPKYYCVYDPEVDLQWCTITTQREARISGWQVKKGPFKTPEACDPQCHTNLLGGKLSSHDPNLTSAIHILKSTNLVEWTECAVFSGDPECFEWSETNTLNGALFYRAYYQ